MEVDDNGSSSGSIGESEVDIEGSENGEIASPEPMDTMEYDDPCKEDDVKDLYGDLELNETPPPASPGGDKVQDNAGQAKGFTADDLPSDDDDSEEGDYNSDNVADISVGQVLQPPKLTTNSSPTKEDRKSNETSATSAASHMAPAVHDDHGELDYEEDVDQETSYEAKKHDISNQKSDVKDEEEEGEHISDDDTDGELDDDDDCEEGEIKDASEKPDDEKDDLEDGEGIDDDEDGDMGFVSQQPVCRFFMYGTCNWGTSCRFIHPGIRTAGSYVEENVPPRKTWNQEAVDTTGEVEPARPAAPVTESAWERGLRQAKELRQKSKKRKETDKDFEEKRKNLSINTDDIEEEEEEEEKPKLVQKDDNKENERDKFQRDPYYDGVFGDLDLPYNEKQSIEGWHGGGHFENFEVHWGGRPQPHQHHPEHYPDFRIPEDQRPGMYKEKHGKNYRHYDRYNKRGNKEDRYNKKFDLSHQLEKSRQNKETGGGGGYNRGEQWADPWQRVKSPVRKRHSSSRSRSRSRRHSRSGSYSSSYSTSSYSSRSRSSSYSSRSSYSRSSSSSSRSSSGSRSPSPSLRQRRPPPMPNPPPAKKHTEIPRSFITKAGPIVGSRSLGGKDGPPPVKQAPPVGKSGPGKSMPPGKSISKAPSNKGPDVSSKVPRASGKVPEKPDLPPPKSAVPMRQTRPPPASKAFHSENRPGRSIQRRSRTYSSASSRSKSSSGSSSRSRSRSSSASSSSSSSSADSDNLYGDMASPTKSPSPKRRHSSKKRSHLSDSNRNANRDSSHKSRYRGNNSSSQGSRRHPGHNMRPPWKSDDKRNLTSQPATKPPVHTAKDPLKMQGQKSSIKLTLKSNKLDSTSALREPEKKRSAEEPAGPPAKKPANKSPTKEPKEPVRINVPKTDKVVKPPSKEPPSKPSAPAAAAAPPKTPPKSAPKPVSEPAKPASTAPPKKKSTSSRREELLKQLKAVEDAIARKRTK